VHTKARPLAAQESLLMKSVAPSPKGVFDRLTQCERLQIRVRTVASRPLPTWLPTRDHIFVPWVQDTVPQTHQRQPHEYHPRISNPSNAEEGQREGWEVGCDDVGSSPGLNPLCSRSYLLPCPAEPPTIERRHAICSRESHTGEAGRERCRPNKKKRKKVLPYLHDSHVTHPTAPGPSLLQQPAASKRPSKKKPGQAAWMLARLHRATNPPTHPHRYSGIQKVNPSSSQIVFVSVCAWLTALDKASPGR
jgi:hypothetical protein